MLSNLYEEAIANEKWNQAKEEEIHSIEKSNMRELTTLHVEKKPIGLKGVYKTKYRPIGEVDRYKVRLVVKSDKQKRRSHEIDCFEVFAPVSIMDTVRMILSLATHNKWQVYQMDDKTAFLNVLHQEEVYVEQPQALQRKVRKQNLSTL